MVLSIPASPDVCFYTTGEIKIVYVTHFRVSFPKKQSFLNMKIFKFSQDFLLTNINISSISKNDMLLADADSTPAHRAREAIQLLQRETSSFATDL